MDDAKAHAAGPSQPTQAAPAIPPEPGASASGLSIATLPARIGLLRLLAGPVQMKARLAPEVADAYVASWVTPRSVQTMLDESMGLGDGLRQAGAVTTFGAAPLIVLSRGLDQRQDWQQQQIELLQMSANSEHMFADISGHNIQLDQPAAAAGAILHMVEHVRGQSSEPSDNLLWR